MRSFWAHIQAFQKLIDGELSCKSKNLSKEHDSGSFVEASDAMISQLSSEAFSRRRIFFCLVGLHQTLDQFNRSSQEGEDHSHYDPILDSIQHCIGLFGANRPVQLIDGKHKGKASCGDDERVVHTSVELHEALVLNYVFESVEG